MRALLVSLFTSLVGLGVVGCATAPRPLVTQDGHELDADLWARDAAAIQTRAAFEFSCPKESLHLTVLNAGIHMDRVDSAVGRATEVGVEACGHRAVYVYLSQNGEWLMNTEGKP
ncbi:MAG: hypothetical protein JST54_21655 [Deltaproteobacteria bacterium]|nr:hypothetical protein [Deltaproteobacteria bacterium]